MPERRRCPRCAKEMSRTLDGSGDWICLPCGRKVRKDDPVPNATEGLFSMFGVKGGSK